MDGKTSSTFSNNAQDTKGSLKETIGKATGNDRLQAEGQSDSLAAKAKNAVNDVVSSVQNAVGSASNSASEAKGEAKGQYNART